MFPVGDDNTQRRTTPVVTFALIGLNVLVFLAELSGGDQFITNWAFVPSQFSEDPGANAVTLFSAMFMHGGWLHLFGNMLFLWIFGDNVEDRFGHVQIPDLLFAGRPGGDVLAILRSRPNRAFPMSAPRARSPACSAPTFCCSRNRG